jgi:hypothetical protein
MIQDGSIGRGVKSTVNLAISISSRDIKNLRASNARPRGRRAKNFSVVTDA